MNQYEPWKELEVTELEYYKNLYVVTRSQIQRVYKTLKNIESLTQDDEGHWCNASIGLHEIKLLVKKALSKQE